MKATVNENKASEGGSNRKYFTGVTNAFVVDLNPTQEKLKQMGYKAEKPPEYFIKDDKDDNNKVTGIKLNFHLEFSHLEETYKTSVTFFLKKEFITSDKNPEKVTTNYIDMYGKTKFLSEEDLLDAELQERFKFLDFGSFKKCIKGQAELIEFLRSYAGTKNDQAMMFEPQDFRELFNGNMNPIVKNVLAPSMAMENSVRVLLGVKEANDKMYQVVYDRKFDFPWSYTTKYIHKSYDQNSKYIPMGVSYGQISSEFNEKDFNLKEYVSDESAQGQPASSPGSMMSSAKPLDNFFGDSPQTSLVSRDELPDDDLPF